MTDNTRVFNVFPVFFREKTGGFWRVRYEGRKSADTGAGAEAGQCAGLRPEQQKSPTPKWGLFLTEYGELDKIDTALHERQAVGHISERRWLICLLRSHYISSDIRSRFVLKAKTATLPSDGFLIFD